MSLYSIGAERYRLGGGGPQATAAPTTASGLSALPTPSRAAGDGVKPWNPANPLFPFAVLAACTFGLMAVSTSGGVSVRLGKTVAGVSGGAGVGSVGK